MKHVAAGLVSLVVPLIAGCLTNGHEAIDEGAVDVQSIQQQAEQDLDYIKSGSGTLTAEGAESVPGKHPRPRRRWHALVSKRSAHAAEREPSAEIVTKRKSLLRERNREIRALKDKGCLGENGRGYVELRPSEYLQDAEKKNAAQRLAAAENKDRKQLYKERARQTGATVSEIERIYASARLKRARPGELFELPPKGEHFEAFKASAAGRRLGETCVPGTWLRIR